MDFKLKINKDLNSREINWELNQKLYRDCCIKIWIKLFKLWNVKWNFWALQL